MKLYRLKKHLLFVSILVCISISHADAQSWVWGREAKSASLTSWGEAEGEHGVAVDASGNTYTTGYFYDTISFGGQTVKGKGLFSGGFYKGINLFLVKYDASGNALWAKQSTQATNTCSAFGNSVALDKAGNVYVTGYFIDTISFGAYTLQAAGRGGSVFVAKYDASGNVLWAKQAVQASSISSGHANSIATDITGNVYITGELVDTISFGSFTLSTTGNYCFFLAKYDASGNVLWAKQGISSGTFRYASGYSVAEDLLGNAYICGDFINSLSIGPFSLNTTQGDAFIAKYDASGNVLWAKQSVTTNPSSACGAFSLTIDGAGGIYITGDFYGNTSFGTFNLTSPASQNDPILAKYTPAGTLLWAKQGTILDANKWYGFSLRSDTLTQGGGYLVLNSEGALRFLPYRLAFGGDTFHLSAPYQSASVILKFDSAGNTLCGSIYCQGDEDDGTGLGVDQTGQYIYLAGDLDTTAIFGPDTLGNAGPIRGEMAFLSRWKSCCGVIPAISKPAAICSGDTITLIAGGGSTYTWNNGATSSSITVTPSSTSTYSVNISKGSCSVTDSVRVTVNQTPVPTISTTQSICPGSTVTLSASGATTYTWVPASGLSCSNCPNPVAGPTTNTTYTVLFTNGTCSAKDSVSVIVKPDVSGTACCNTVIERGSNTTLNVTGAAGGSSFNWTPAEGLSCTSCPDPTASPVNTTTYYVTITDSNGCSRIDTITVEVDCGNVFVPEAFSPNNDGQNDVLYVRGNCIKVMDFKIFDRWGNRVFESNSPGEGWDGRHNNLPMNTGTFVYYLKAIMFDNSTVTKEGNITLIR